MSDSPVPDVFAQAQIAIDSAEHALLKAKSALMEAERRVGRERRARSRMTPDRRHVVGDIIDLAALPPDTQLRVAQLAKYWSPCHHNSVLYWIRTQRLPATQARGIWFVRAADALAFQPLLYSLTQSRLPKRTTDG
jgi:hypothetical protein